MYYVYIIESKKSGQLYKGFTKNIKNRLKEHNSGITKSTKNFGPWKLIYCEIFLNKYDALERERYFKSGWGRRYLKKALKNYFINRQSN